MLNENKEKHVPNGQTETTIQRLLSVSEELFSKKGFADTSIREIGIRVGVANSTILYYFSTKEKIYIEVLKRIESSLESIILDSSDHNGSELDQIMGMLERFIDWTWKFPQYNQIMVREIMENGNRLKNNKDMYLIEFINEVKRPLDILKDKGKIDSIDPMLFLIQTIGAISYMSIALPTVGKITGNLDNDLLMEKNKQTILTTVYATLK
ncbi:TetR/AcrR family transcriptional regulator [Viridibacillus sp. NPDC093762]|uniref:TetR/AcrR family transcriptional regulator n=1 Tax=Viridibacillus sp. NPDC093762 TaxID=3390720 RepID=UPI003D07FF91